MTERRKSSDGINSILQQWKLLQLLGKSEEGMTLEMLARELDVDTRTVSRYLERLRKAEFPLDWTAGEHRRKWWRIKPGQFIQAPEFTYDEVAAFYLGQYFLHPLQGTFLGEAARRGMGKIREHLGASVTQYLEKILAIMCYSTSGWSDYEAKSAMIDTLFQACEDRRQVELHYHAARTDTMDTYHVHPYNFRYSNGALYLIGHSCKRDMTCIWKLDRVLDVRLTTDTFTVPADFDLETFTRTMFDAFPSNDTPPELISIRISPSGAVRRAYEHRWHATQQNIPQPDGSTIIEFTLPVTPELKYWILNFGSKAEVLEPESLREAVAEEVRRMRDIYG